jgi:antitoxin PrlF
MKSIVSEKGQITIPKKLRDSLGLRAGTELDFHEEEGKLVALPVVASDPLMKLVGILPRMSVDSKISELRGPGWSSRRDGGRRGHRGR